MKRLTESKRVNFEKQATALLKKLVAFQEPDEIGNLVDKKNETDPNIKDIVESLMQIMKAKSVASKYHVEAGKKSKKIDKKADMPMQSPHPQPMQMDSNEGPYEEAEDLENPVMRPIEDLEHEVQSLDDETLMHLVQELEERLKADLHMDQGAPEMPHPSEMPQPNETTPPQLNPEQRLALLMNLPTSERLKKAANLRALAEALTDGIADHEVMEAEVSDDNQMVPSAGDLETTLDKEVAECDSEEARARQMGEATTASEKFSLVLKNTINAIQSEKAAKKAVKKESKLEKKALRRLAAGVFGDDATAQVSDEMIKEALLKVLAETTEEDTSTPGHDAEFGEDASQHDDPKESEKEFDDAQDKHPEEAKKELNSFEKEAILKARIATLKDKKGTLDGHKMPTPKEVPTPNVDHEDTLKGDATIQYSPATPEKGMDEIYTKRQKLPDSDEGAAGEANELYAADSSEGAYYHKPGSSKDDMSEANNSRSLEDEGVAYQSHIPDSPSKMQSKKKGDHPEPQEWEKVKKENDKTPGGERLVGLATQEIKKRVARAFKLATRMANSGLIKTEPQLREKIIALSAMEDGEFNTVDTFFNDQGQGQGQPGTMPSDDGSGSPEVHVHKHDHTHYHGEDEPDEDAESHAEHEDGNHEMEHESENPQQRPERAERPEHNDEGEEPEEMTREASNRVRRHSEKTSSQQVRKISRVADDNRGGSGLKRPLLVGDTGNFDALPRPTSRGSEIFKKLARMEWTTPQVVADRNKSLLDGTYSGGSPEGLTSLERFVD